MGEKDKMISMPRITCPLCTQDDLELAVRTIQMCAVDKPAYGFTRPFFGPGGKYGECWWSLDGALIVDGYKWIDPSCERDFLLNMMDTQEPDGRVKLYGMDDFAHIPSVQVPVGSIPKFYETFYHTLRRENDPELTAQGFVFLEKNLNWWFSNRQDRETGLISAVFEETFFPNIEFPVMEYCPVDTNMQLAAGCRCTAEIAGWLGLTEKQQFFHKKGEDILEAVNRYLWNEEKQAYYPYLLSEKKQTGVLMASCFNAMRFGCAGKERTEALLQKLTDPDWFGWGEHALTTVSKQDPLFTVVEGTYIGNPCWSGSVWTLTNKAVIQALDSCGQRELAARLACQTIQEFRGDFTEFHHPVTGEGHGVLDYGWTAAQWIQILVEDIFGIDYDAIEGKVTIRPNIPEQYAREYFALENLILPDGGRISVSVIEGKVQYKYDSGRDQKQISISV